MAIPTLAEWKRQTNIHFSGRSSELRAVDTALADYWNDTADPARLKALTQAIIGWVDKKSHFEGSAGGQTATADWRMDPRNSSGIVSNLHDTLTMADRDLSAEEEAAVEFIANFNDEQLRVLLSDKQISVKVGALATLVSQARTIAKDLSNEIKGIRPPDFDPMMVVREFLKYVDFRMPSFGISLRIPDFLGWLKDLDINLDLFKISWPDLFFPWVKLNFPDLEVLFQDFLGYLKFNWPNLNFAFGISMPDFNIDLALINIPRLHVPSIDLELDLAWLRLDWNISLDEIIPDFHILMEFPDLVASFTDGLKALWLDCVPFLGAGKSAFKALRGYGTAIQMKFDEAAMRADQEGTYGSNGAEDAFEAVAGTLAAQAYLTSVTATIDLATAGAQTGGVFLDGGVASGPAFSVANLLAKYILTINYFIADYKRMVKANEILKEWSDGKLTKPIADILAECPLVGCFLIYCSDTSAILNVDWNNIGRAAFVSDVDMMATKAAKVRQVAHGFILTSKFEIKDMPKLVKAESNPAAAVAAVVNAWKFRLKATGRTRGYVENFAFFANTASPVLYLI